MKSRQRIQRIKLDLSSFDGSELFGLVSAEPDYKLSLSLNSKLRISLKSSGNVNVSSSAGKEISFPKYSYSSDKKGLSVTLTVNRSGNTYLVSKLLNIDYLLFIQSHFDEPDTERIMKSLKDMSSITATFRIDPHSINDKNLHHIIN